MHVISCRISQSAALVFKMNVSCITTPQIVYYPSWVSISGSKSVSCWVSSSSSKHSAKGRAVCEYVYPVGKWMIWEGWAPEVLPVQVGGKPGSGAVGSGVRSLGWTGGCAPVSFASPACLRIFGGAILARKAGGRLVLTKHCRVSLYRNLHLVMPRKLNTPLLPFSDLGA